jgi:hypothetical protein
MSRSRETYRRRTDDHLVTVISSWLVQRVSDDELQRELSRARPGALEPKQAEALEELQLGLENPHERPELEMVARETLEVLAVGG